MDLLFLDANVLFCASYRVDSGLLKLWEFPDTRLVCSAYVVGEARRNVTSEEQRQRLEGLLAKVSVLPHRQKYSIPEGIDLPEKDRPVLGAAIEAGATHLLTGDLSHFGRYFGRRVQDVLILPPADYVRSRDAAQ